MFAGPLTLGVTTSDRVDLSPISGSNCAVHRLRLCFVDVSFQ